MITLFKSYKLFTQIIKIYLGNYRRQVDEDRRSPENQNINQEPSPRYEQREKDPEVTETYEDSRTAKKLQQQREEKRLE